MIDITKTYRTRDGREVRIYATDGGGIYPVHGAILCDGEWITESWAEDGRWDRLKQRNKDENDLIEVKPRIQREVWLNVYRQDDGAEFFEVYGSKTYADDYTGDARIACVRLTIDVEEGEGL